MSEPARPYTPASRSVLRWLTDPGPGVGPQIHGRLLAELFTSPRAVVMGVINGLVLNGVALLLCERRVFGAFMVVELVLSAIRLGVLRRAALTSQRGEPTPTDAFLVTAILWCALQGIVAFFCLRSGQVSLEVLSTATIMGLMGPLCARNYPAPRLALLLVCLCNTPFIAGALSTGDPWMIALVLQMPLYLIGSITIIRRFQVLAIDTLQAQYDSQHRAHHDPLTGLPNRLGLAEAKRTIDAETGPMAVFYLDLDGFKDVNDTLGHDAGDMLLQAAAQRLVSVTRRNDVAIRLGGDEFVVLACDMTLTEAEDFADRLIEIVSRLPYDLGSGNQIAVGVSVGFATALGGENIDLDELRRRADIALYRAKAAGKGVQRRFEIA